MELHPLPNIAEWLNQEGCGMYVEHTSMQREHSNESGFWKCVNEPLGSINAKEHLDYLTICFSRRAWLE
jgi:hypothetical protein